MQVSDQLHALAGLAPGKELQVQIGYEAGWASQLVWTTWRREHFCLYRDSNSDPSAVHPVTSRCTDYEGIAKLLEKQSSQGCTAEVMERQGEMLRQLNPSTESCKPTHEVKGNMWLNKYNHRYVINILWDLLKRRMLRWIQLVYWCFILWWLLGLLHFNKKSVE
jgi:hypothetical protein